MRPKPIPRPAQGETDMFRNRLDNMIDMRHEFVRLTKLIDWKRFDEAFGDLYAEKGRPGLPTRLMVGLHMRAKAVDSSQMQRVTVDTTAQTKAIAHPTDSHLLLRAIEWLNKLAKKQGV